MQFLLDANILSALLRNPFGPIEKQIRFHGIDAVCTSIIAASELRFGAYKIGSARLTSEVEHLFERLPVIPFDVPADKHYAELRASLERAGTPIGANDMLIAAHALALGYTLVTNNDREFARVKSLKVENWLR
ncbi:MAG TPA: type II toxin-antitoxin system VapC family toxin [Rhizomicrobium sp.]|nr:type II toxin-antitoxin system VapC family toxin [Rhizomicrobium sp.]